MEVISSSLLENVENGNLNDNSILEEKILPKQPIEEKNIVLRKVGSTVGGFCVTVPNTLDELLELSSKYLKLEVKQIWNGDKVCITKIQQLKDDCIYYGATEKNISELE